MKRLAAFWLAIALMMSTGWAAPTLRGPMRTHVVCSIRQKPSCSFEPPQRTPRADRAETIFAAPSVSDFFPSSRLAYALFQRPPCLSVSL